MHRKALGKGLDALFGSSISEEPSSEEPEKASSRKIIKVPLNDIIPNRTQPREQFSQEAMEELKHSIVTNGILEPPIVRRKGDFFELIAGERRYRAAKELNFDTIEVIVMDVDSDDKMLILSLIENIQREDLNAIEEGKAYQQIMNRMNLTQEELASTVGKSRSAVANTLRLLTLSVRVQTMISDGSLAAGSARALIPVENEHIQYKLALKIASEGLSSRKAEALVKHALSEKKPEHHKDTVTMSSPFIESVRLDIQRMLGTEVKIKGNGNKGRIEIDYYSQDDLTRILEAIKGRAEE